METTTRPATAAELRSKEFRARIHANAIARLAVELGIREEEAKRAYESELVNLGRARIKDFVPILATKRVRKLAARRMAA